MDGSATVVPDDAAGLTPVFINEAAYAEKRIALSLTRREVWPVDPRLDQGARQLDAGLIEEIYFCRIH